MLNYNSPLSIAVVDNGRGEKTATDGDDLQKKIEKLIENASSGNRKSLVELLRLSDESESAAVATANMFFSGQGNIVKDTAVAYSLYYIAASKGNQESKEILLEHSPFDIDACYYCEQLIYCNNSEMRRVMDCIDIEKVIHSINSSKSRGLQQIESEEALHLKGSRDDLNKQTKEWVAKRDALNAQVRELVEEAGKHRTSRDELNQKVRESKALRDEANQKVSQLTEEYHAMKKDQPAPDKNQPSVRQLKKEFADLENRQQTQVLKKKEEEALVKRLKEINEQIAEIEKTQEQSGDIREKSGELRAAKEEAERCHKLVSEYAEKAQAEHDAMIQLYEQADALRKQADEAQAKFIECKKAADEEHNRYINVSRGRRQTQS